MYIPIRKVAENKTFADFHFGGCSLWVPDENRPRRRQEHLCRFGRLRIDKRTGEVTLVFVLPGDESNFYFARAARKVWQHWVAGGELPNEMCWAT